MLMKVKELISVLRKKDQNLEVQFIVASKPEGAIVCMDLEGQNIKIAELFAIALGDKKKPIVAFEITKINPGDKIQFAEEKKSYTVMAKGKRYIVCTKSFNLRNTVLYTVIDCQKKIRGTENLIFGAGAETLEECEDMVNRLEAGETEVSHRNYVQLQIEKVNGVKVIPEDLL